MMSKNRRVLLLSTSRIHGTQILDFAADTVRDFLNKSNVKRVAFVPYAVVEHDDYTNTMRDAFKRNKLDFELTGIHESGNPADALAKADAIYIGGGNTFLLLSLLQKHDLLTLISDKVMKDGIPYIGSSAGSNVATVNICTTNDMPIVPVQSLLGLKLVPFNINPHYMDPDPNSTHMGETREQRINQYHQMDLCYPVLGLREGSMLHVEGDKAKLIGKPNARLFRKGEPPEELPEGTDLSFLLNP